MFATISDSVAAYDDMLNEGYAPTGSPLDFPPADVLRMMDPIAYKCGWLDYMDALDVDTDDLEDDYTFSRDRM